MILFANNASTSLAADCTESDSFIDVLPGTAAIFPASADVDDYFLITLVNPNDGGIEIMKVTSVYGDRFNVSRAQEGTEAMAFPQNTIVENRLTAGSLTQLLNDIAATTTDAGRIRIATLAEALAGIVQDAAITPYTLNAVVQANIQPLIDSITNEINEFKNSAGYLGYPGELKFFFEATAPTNWMEAAGGLIEDANTVHPLLWTELQKPANAWKLTSQSNWDALHNAVFATDAQGTSYRWNNVGGVARFVVDTTANTIRVPDLREMHIESAGANTSPGTALGDQVRIKGGTGSVVGSFGPVAAQGGATGAFTQSGGSSNAPFGFGGPSYVYSLNTSYLLPTTGEVTRPKSVTALLCVCLGNTIS